MSSQILFCFFPYCIISCRYAAACNERSPRSAASEALRGSREPPNPIQAQSATIIVTRPALFFKVQANILLNTFNADWHENTG
jgi:hypothetical protein